MAASKGSKKPRSAGERAQQASRTSRNKNNQARARLRHKTQHAKQIKPLITARWRRRHPNELHPVTQPATS